MNVNDQKIYGVTYCCWKSFYFATKGETKSISNLVRLENTIEPLKSISIWKKYRQCRRLNERHLENRIK